MSDKAEDLGIKNVRLLTEVRADGVTRWMDMSSAYDLRSHPKNYGIHGAQMNFGVKRGDVAVTLYWMTPFHLAHVREELNGKTYVGDLFDGLGGIDYHSPVALHEWQTPRETCEHTGGICFSDGTATGAGDLWEKFIQDPEELWKELESWLVDTEKRVAEQRELTRNMT